jgi:hypothetical protein
MPDSAMRPPATTRCAQARGQQDQRIGQDVGDDDIAGAGWKRIRFDKRQRRRFWRALASLARTACGSTSTPATRPAPSFGRSDGEDAGTAAVVEHRFAAGQGCSRSHSRQSRVVGCDPVPKASPGPAAG